MSKNITKPPLIFSDSPGNNLLTGVCLHERKGQYTTESLFVKNICHRLACEDISGCLTFKKYYKNLRTSFKSAVAVLCSFLTISALALFLH